MAKVFGKAGRYTSDEAARQRNKRWIIGVGAIAFLAFFEGVTLSSLWAKLSVPWLLNTVVQCVGVVGLGVVGTYGFRKLNESERSGKKWQRGADGESAVGRILADFPDNFYVINDVSTECGNLDHVVVGPTGVFVLDAKNWRGLVTPDGKGELLLNGKPTPKPYLRQFVGRVMGTKEKVRILAPGPDPFFQSAFVFTSARVEAKWGKTGNVHCVTDDSLRDYIVEKNFGKRLSSDEVQRLAGAFRGLAHMDPDYTEKTTTTHASVPGLVRPIAAKA